MEVVPYLFTSILLFFALYGFALVLLGTQYHIPKDKDHPLPGIKVLLPAYRPDEVFLQVLQSLQTAIGKHPVDVVILFQNTEANLISKSSPFGFEILAKDFDHLPGNSYHHALQYLTNHLDESTHDYTVIFDKDNLVDPHFFDRLVQVGLPSYDILQGTREPIETDNGLQVFDALSERYNDLMLRMGKCQMGGVLEVSGSAALIKTSLFKDAIERLDPSAPGYDKNFMVKLLTSTNSLKTGFDRELKVYEEKTAALANYQSQRLRWFGEQYYNALYHAKTLLSTAFAKGQWRCLDYWLTLMRPPRSIQLAMSLLLVAVDLLDMSISWISFPLLFNVSALVIVGYSVVSVRNLLRLAPSACQVLWTNAITACNSLKKKYLGTFIHTR